MTDLAGPTAYFATRLGSQAWDAASDTDKAKALVTAERQLQAYEDRTDRATFTNAVYEQALWLLSGDNRAELQQAGVVSATLGSLSETYQLRRDPTVAPQAWAFLRGRSLKAGGLR
jgi:elongation factor P hydroxylase